MFVLSRNVSASFRVIATLVATAVVLWATGAYSFAQAANITSITDLMSDSAPSADSDHTITFTLPNDLLDTEEIEIDFDSTNGFDFTGVTAADFSISAGSGVFSEGVVTATDIITFTKDSGTVASGTVVTVLIDGTNKINNPAVTGSYEIDISAGTDVGHARIAIVDTVEVTATVDTTFTFVVQGNDGGEDVNGVTTTSTSTATTIPFGTITAGSGNAKVLSQDLIVNSNSINGFVVTVESDGQLESETGADIDNYDEDVVATTPAPWSSPEPTVGDEKSWGHWGMTTEDDDTTRTNEFSGDDTWLGVTTTPTVIYSHTGVADGVTAGIGSTTVGYKVEITALQEAADDYTATLTYIATPTF